MKKVLLTIVTVLCWCAPVLAGSSDQQVRLSFYDGNEYLVSDFSFYTDHYGVQGMYFKSTTDSIEPLLVEDGNLWHEVQGKDITKIRLEAVTDKQSLKASIVLKGGRTISGFVPIALDKTWKSGDYFYVEGTTTKFGKPAKFRARFSDIALIDSLDDSPKGFSIKTKEGEEKTATAIEFGLYGSMPYSSPGLLSLYNSIELISDGLKVEIPLEDIQSFAFDEASKITMLMRNGETGAVSLGRFTRIYGRLKTGEIIFNSISSPEGAKIKLIDFPKSTQKTK